MPRLRISDAGRAGRLGCATPGFFRNLIAQPVRELRAALGRRFVVRRLANDARGLISRCGHYRPPHSKCHRARAAKNRKQADRIGVLGKNYH